VLQYYFPKKITKERTNEKASASEEDALFLLPKAEGGPGGGQDDGSCWTPELARLSLPCRRPMLHGFSHHLLLQRAICSSPSDSNMGLV
jgi:hypothetical protein